MKKLIALVMAFAIICSFAGCFADKEDKKEDKNKETTEQIQEDTADEQTEVTGEAVTFEELEIKDTTTALEILDSLWLGMGAEHQPAAYGGHISEEHMHGPYTYELTYAEDLAATLLLPEDQMSAVIDAATVVHMLNANSMTTGVLKLKEGTDVKAFADAVAARISQNRWMCGFPEKMTIIQIDDDYLFVGYGLYELLDRMEGAMGKNWNINELYNQPLE